MFTACPGNVGGFESGETSWGQASSGNSTGVNFKYVYGANDYAVFTWEESKDKSISYYVLDFESDNPKKTVKSEKIQKNGGPYNYKLKEFELSNSGFTFYSGYLYGYDSSDKKLFSEYTYFSICKSELTDFNVNYDSSRQTVTCSWKRNDKYGMIKKICILSSDAENGTYSVCKTLDSVYDISCDLTELGIETTYWFKLCSYDSAGNVITESSAVNITIEKAIPCKINNLKTAKSDYYNVVNLTWDNNLFATSYKVLAYSENTLQNLLFEKTVTENNASFTVDCIENSKTLYFVVKGINEMGEGPVSSYKMFYLAPLCLYAKVASTVSDVTANTAKVVLKMIDGNNGNKEYSLKDVTLEYALYKDSEEYKTYQESNEFTLTDLEFASSIILKPRVKVKYTLEGELKEWELIPSLGFNVQTGSFQAPSGSWKATKITRGSITVEFPTLAEEQRCGIAAEDIVYVVTAYKGNSTYSSSTQTASYGETSVTFNSLSSASDYCFTVYAKKNGDASPAGKESERSQVFTTSDKLSKPVIKSISEVTVAGVESPYSNIKVTFDPIEEDAQEDIKYGLVWDIMNEKFDDFYDGKSTEDKENITQIIEKVNGGNRYVVCLYAYDATEGKDTIVYSAKEAYQLAPVDDKHILPGLYYTDEAGAKNAGELVDIVNPATWLSGKTPKSTGSNFNWGVSNRTGSYVVKFKLTDEMLTYDNYNLKIIFAAQRYTYKNMEIDGTKLAYGVIVRLINPITGDALTTFVDYTTSQTFDPFHIPDLSSNSSYGPKPSSSSVGVWIKNFEKYMFNNSVYFGLYVPPTFKEYEWSSEEKDNSKNCIAFSYYME